MTNKDEYEITHAASKGLMHSKLQLSFGLCQPNHSLVKVKVKGKCENSLLASYRINYIYTNLSHRHIKLGMRYENTQKSNIGSR
jgi:hypothetical protein